MTVATMAVTTVCAGSTAFAFTGTGPVAATQFGPTFRADPLPPAPTWDVPAVVTPSRTTVPGSRFREHVEPDQIVDIPSAASTAYQRSAAILDEAAPRCRLRWTLLAAVGRVLTDHGRRGDRRLDVEGNARPALVGKPLPARGGGRAGDTDAGRIDGDQRFDRPVGPMLLAPADWSVVGVDGDSDGNRNPHDLDDASLAVAVLLCAARKDLRTAEGKRAALRRIDDSAEFVRAVLRVDAAYQRQLRSGVKPVPFGLPPTMPTLPTPPPAYQANRTTPYERPADADRDPGKRPSGNIESSDRVDQSGSPDRPAPAPEPEPAPTSTAVTATYDPGVLQIYGAAVVSARGAAPQGTVTFTLSGPGGSRVVQGLLAGGSATARFEVTEPGAYTLVATYRGASKHAGSAGSSVLQVTLPPSTEPPTEPATEASTEPSAG